MRDVVFVTGTPGWLGSALVEALKKNKRKVRCLVLKGASLLHLQNLGVEIVEGDIAVPSSIKDDYFTDVCTVFHCAGIIHPKLFRARDFYKINRDGTKNLLEKSVSAGVEKFIYISSNAAAGVNKVNGNLMREGDTENPYTDYGKSKWQAEQVVKEFQNKRLIKTVIIRPCWFYGPKLPDRMIKLAKMIKSGKPLLFGDGKNLRSMTYVYDLVDALILAEKNNNAIGQTYWITDERPYTTIEIYRTMAKIFEVDNLEFRKIPASVSIVLELVDKTLGKFGIYEINFHVGGEMTRDIAVSIEKAKNELGWKPKHGGLEEGMRESLKWAMENNLI
ncbi:NAD-dependent epimerase/dehydratase family protein [Candidatus Woesearchaeota archaeon]|nr:NAD-dependent epimerase/dehydratase family protein [Candidatus Woesearchaeota archaeon]